MDINFYVCPVCGNVTVSSGDAEVKCCGRTLKKEQVGISQGMKVSVSDGEYYVSVGHPMTKDHYFSFFAAVSDSSVQFVKLFPEGKAEARFRMDGVDRIYMYCTRHGLYVKKI